MPNFVKVARQGRGRSWVGSFMAGTVAGALVGWLARGTRAERRGLREPRRRPRWDRLSLAWDEAMDGLARVHERVTEDGAEPDLPGLRARLDALPGGHGVRLHDLGGGIVEVVGVAETDEVARALLSAVSGCPGVDVVVNRVWTPSSARP